MTMAIINYGSTTTTNNDSTNGGMSYQSVPTSSQEPKDISLDYYGGDELAQQNRRRRRRLTDVGKLFVLAVLTFAAYYSYHRLKDKNTNDFSYQYVEKSNYSRADYQPPPAVQKGKRQPFSQVHPCLLGVPQFSRPLSSRPAAVLTHLDHQQEQEEEEEEEDNTKNQSTTSNNHRPFPTNAWYQNMLLLPNTAATNGSTTTTTTSSSSEPTLVNRVYATPFLVDAVGPVPGLRVIPNQAAASTTVIQLNDIVEYGLTLGAAPNAAAKAVMMKNNNKTKNAALASKYSKEYRVERMTPLGLTLGWPKTFPMTSSIVKGMPYGTMVYESMAHVSNNTKDGEIWYPTVASEIPLAKDPVVDGGKVKMTCLNDVSHDIKTSTISGPSSTSSGGGNTTATRQTLNTNSSTHASTSSSSNSTHGGQPQQVLVEKEIELHFAASDFTWLVFVSKPVMMQCVVDPQSGSMQLQVVNDGDKTATAKERKKDEAPLVIRIALAKPCTSNKNPIYCHHEQMLPYTLNLGQGRYDDLLRNHSHLVPGPETDIDYHVDDVKNQINVEFDWDTRDMRDYHTKAPVRKTSVGGKDLIVFALPHHLDLMGTRNAPGYLKYCASTLIGPACLLAGSRWKMVESMPRIDFRAPRPPAPWAIQSLAESAKKDIRYKLPKLYQKGAGDTYFSGKMLAKLGRVLAITEELKELCDRSKRGSVSQEYRDACRRASLPTDREVRSAVATLRSSVEVWLNGKAITPFVFDDAWGGIVSCGCNNPDGGECRNEYPECPAFQDPGLNFGNAFYNDLHFHYGYHIYAAAVVSHFDPDWGKKYFERVMLLVRNIANPAESGDYFPAFRHKDWYQGHSWASGVVPPYLNGRNQESSSESIAAYEAVALYGKVMSSVFGDEEGNLKVAREVEKAGKTLTATELRSTRRYYHVRDESNANKALKIYPSEYSNHAIGMMWSSMAQYQTWFGGKPYLAIGIQILPITPISEQRDGAVWLSEMYPAFAKTCAANKECEENGWSVLQLASLATIGYMEKAAKDALSLPPSVFESAGGNGHSLTNTLWYIATRVVVDEPMNPDSGYDDETQGGIGNNTASTENSTDTSGGSRTEQPHHDQDIHILTNCYQPRICTDYILDTIADEYSCRQRITYMMDTMGHTQEEACFTVAKIQFPEQCGACVPNATTTTKSFIPQCPPCTVDQCESSLNRCPQFRQTFVCTEGSNTGGCSRFPWDVRSKECSSCCELTECHSL